MVAVEVPDNLECVVCFDDERMREAARFFDRGVAPIWLTDVDHAVVDASIREALFRLDGTEMSVVAAMTKLSPCRIEELGGL